MKAAVKSEAALAEFPPSPGDDLQYHGGKIIPHLRFANFYIGGSQSWNEDYMASIDKALAAAMSDKALNNLMAQYFDGENITSTLEGSKVLEGIHPDSFYVDDAEKLIQDLYEQKKLDSYDLKNTVINFLLPSQTRLYHSYSNNQADKQKGSQTQHRNKSGATSTSESTNLEIDEEAHDSYNGLGGFHDSVDICTQSGKKITVYYAVGVYSEQLSTGHSNGIVVFDEPWKNVVATFYHELNEARTDPDTGDANRADNDQDGYKFLGWISANGDECGDITIKEDEEEGYPLSEVFKEVDLDDGSGRVPIQLMYSNYVHGPEGPIAAPHPMRQTSVSVS